MSRTSLAFSPKMARSSLSSAVSSVSLSHRHFGIGGDGVVLMEKSDVADVKMRMYNLDGSEGKMCGNALRCIGKYVYENGFVPKTNMTIETLSGIKEVKLFVNPPL